MIFLASSVVGLYTNEIQQQDMDLTSLPHISTGNYIIKFSPIIKLENLRPGDLTSFIPFAEFSGCRKLFAKACTLDEKEFSMIFQKSITHLHVDATDQNLLKKICQTLPNLYSLKIDDICDSWVDDLFSLTFGMHLRRLKILTLSPAHIGNFDL
uniref:Uncharacterized protein n=1 Tax=Panagrolaimus sp. JU765 TaxID=591449 RepID=A0AC34R6S9_9BILA